MEADLWALYHQMWRSRRFEEAVTELWHSGRISGEMHLGTGEEAIAAGIVPQLEEGDALALDHRGTPPLVMRGVDLRLLLREFMGCGDGLCGGMGGHMHLFSPDHLAASSGIVGAAAPAAAGFALAGRHLRPHSIAVAFFGEGAMNQGMVMEAFNLAAVWELPVLFVCKDDRLSITTQSADVTGGDLCDRARSFGLRVFEVDGADVETVWKATNQVLAGLRAGAGPAFLLAHCAHLEGHFLGYPPLRIMRSPVQEFSSYLGPLTRSMVTPGGASPGERLAGLSAVTSLFRRVAGDQHWNRRDPVERLRQRLLVDRPRLEQLEREVDNEINRAVQAAAGE